MTVSTSTDNTNMDRADDSLIKLYIGLFFVYGFFISIIPQVSEQSVFFRLSISLIVCIISGGQMTTGIGLLTTQLRSQSLDIQIGLGLVILCMPLLVCSIFINLLMYDCFATMVVGILTFLAVPLTIFLIGKYKQKTI